EEPEIVLPMIFEFLLRTISEQPELMRLLYFSALELPGGQPMYQTHLGPIFDSIQTYFSHCASSGLLCDVDPRILTLAAAGAVIANMSAYEVFVGHALPIADLEGSANSFAEFWLKLLVRRHSLVGMQPPNPDLRPDNSELPTQG